MLRMCVSELSFTIYCQFADYMRVACVRKDLQLSWGLLRVDDGEACCLRYHSRKLALIKKYVPR